MRIYDAIERYKGSIIHQKADVTGQVLTIYNGRPSIYVQLPGTTPDTYFVV